VQATLKQRDEEVPWLDGELTQLSVSLADQRQAVEEQEAMVLSLQQAAEAAHMALDSKKKQVEGESPLFAFCSLIRFVLGSAPQFLFFLHGFQACGMLGNSMTQAESLQAAYNSSQ
jgi:hypothetical protein